ncbi:MAG: hemolysin family protein [Caldilineaceae bacterium]|nr:hemolysin family protein [Caldilineaceae bacterium]
MSELWLPLSIIGFLLVVNGFFVAAEFALAASPVARVARLAEDGSAAAARLLAILRDSRAFNTYISTAQVGITIASLGLGMYGEHIIAEWLVEPLAHWGRLGDIAAHTVATILAVTMLTYLHVVLGEMIPKSLALAAPDTAAMHMGPWLHAAQWLFRPLTWLLTWAGDAILRLVGIPPVDAKARLVSSAELEYIVEESAEGGLLEPTSQRYLENVLDFSERSLSQVMTPRTRIQALPIDATLDDVLRAIADHGYSRYPVYEQDRDNIIGILYVKDLARHVSQPAAPFDLQTLVRPAVYAPETVSLENMLQRFRTEHIQIAIVVDEFGGTAGLVTLEDLVEEIIGEIQDEFDEEIPPLEEIGLHTLRIRGDLLIDELNQQCELELSHSEADTIGGLVMAMLGRIPEPGEEVEVDGVHFRVETVERLAVGTVIVHLPVSTAATDQGANPTSDPVASREQMWTAQG